MNLKSVIHFWNIPSWCPYLYNAEKRFAADNFIIFTPKIMFLVNLPLQHSPPFFVFGTTLGTISVSCISRPRVLHISDWRAISKLVGRINFMYFKYSNDFKHYDNFKNHNKYTGMNSFLLFVFFSIEVKR